MMAERSEQKPDQNMTLERLNSLYELIGRMNSVYELSALLEFVADRALSLTGGSRGLLLLQDDRERSFQDIAVVRGAEINDADVERALEFVSTTVIKDVLAEGEPRLVIDLPQDQRYETLGTGDTFRFKKVRSVLAVPLKVEANLVGLIYIDHPRRNIFDQTDLDFLSAFASQAALAINRARQYQQRVDALTRLNELSRSVVQVLDLDEVLTRIVDEAIRMLNVETGSVLLLDEAKAELTFSVSVSNGKRVEIEAALKLGQGLAGLAAALGEIVNVSDVRRDSRWYGEVEDKFDTRSLLCVPLQSKTHTLGVLQVLNKKDDQGFSSQDETYLAAFAASATIAIENARLFAEASEARRLRSLNQSALKLSRTLDLETILTDGLDEVVQLLGTDAGILNLTNHQRNTDTFIAKTETPELEALNPSGGQKSAQTEAIHQLTQMVLAGIMGEALLIDDLSESDLPQASVLLAAGGRALALAPIRAGDEAAGTLGILYHQPHNFSDDEVNLLCGLAHVMSLATQNALQHEQVKAKTNQLAYLNEIGEALTGSIEMGEVLTVFIEGVNALLQTERTSVFLINEQTHELVLRHSSPFGADIRLTEPWEGIAGWVAQNNEPALVNDTHNDPRFLQSVATRTGYDVHSLVCVPLKIEDKVIGVVEALNKVGEGQFTLEHQNLLIGLSHWAAIAIQTARLYEAQVQAQKRRVEAETRSAMAELILNMAHTMNNIVGAIRAWTLNLDQAVQRLPDTPVHQFHSKIRHIQENAQEAIDLIGNIRNPLENLNVQPGPTDVHACLTNAIDHCRWPHHLRLTQAFSESLPLVWASAEGLEAAFHNLISNAIQALSAQGGEITISTRYVPANHVEIIIADNGPGIPSELQSRIFQPGISGQNGKLGLGLWLVETFIRRFDGQISVDSSPETGTVFTLRLVPAAQAKMALLDLMW